MRIKTFKYCSPFILFVLAYLSFTNTGWVTFVPVFYAYILIPVAELFIQPDPKNLEAAEEEIARQDRLYDYILYMVPVLMYASLALFLFSLKQPGLNWVSIVGRINTMGLLCGVFGINVAHELGHRVNRFEQFLAKALLLTSLYMHFIIEHNKGHHKKVGTYEDPATARLNEPIFSFFARTIKGSYVSAWEIANRDSAKKHKKVFSLHNEMVLFTLIELLFLLVIFLAFGWMLTLYFLAAAVIGILLLETVNYIEHYGLSRKEIEPGKYERAMPKHSWNSDHLFGRLMLFELSRHSDHHYMASRKYQLLRHHENAPQMPTGYPGMMILAHFPPIFFHVMNKQIKKYDEAAV